MEYVEKVLLATGATVSTEEDPQVEEDTQAALEKNEDDPCWSGYVQVGMKDKNGKRVPNCVPSAAAIDYLVASINSEYGISRHVTKDTAYAVAKKACSKYSYLDDDTELFSAIMYDLHVFASHATSGILDVDADFLEYAEYLPAGHPDTESSLVAAATWVAGAPELDNSGREALLQAFSEDSDYVRTLHASTRVRAMVSSGSLADITLSQIKNLSDRYSKVN
jgi:hypothetical protein